jgi:hypothetical protein
MLCGGDTTSQTACVPLLLLECVGPTGPPGGELMRDRVGKSAQSPTHQIGPHLPHVIGRLLHFLQGSSQGFRHHVQRTIAPCIAFRPTLHVWVPSTQQA